MSLVVVILNYRTPELTVACLASLAGCVEEVPETRVVVLDNASADGSVERIRRGIEQLGFNSAAGPCRVELMASEQNLGFAGGNNFVLRRVLRTAAEGDAYLLLNSDTVCRPGVLGHCYAELWKLRRDRPVGVVTCRLENADGSLQRNARRLPTPVRQTFHGTGLTHHFPRLMSWADLEDASWDRRAVREVEWVGGAFMMIRGEVLRRAGLLDESFFFYGEDVEFCWRVARAGYGILYDGRVGITHLGGGSSEAIVGGEDRQPRARRSRLAWEARYLIQRKCYGHNAERYLRWLDRTNYALRATWGRLSGAENPAHRDTLALLRSLSPTGRAPAVEGRASVAAGSVSMTAGSAMAAGGAVAQPPGGGKLHGGA